LRLSSWNHRGCCWLALVCSLDANLCAAPATADAAAPAREPFLVDVRLSTGVATANFTQSDYPVADFDAVALSVTGRAGGFIGPQVRLGGEIFLGSRWAVGGIDVRDEDFFSIEGRPSGGTYTIVSPLGVFAEFYPSATGGLFFGASAAVGLLSLPAFSDDGGPLVMMSGFGAELGYDLMRVSESTLGVSLRYTQWQGEEFIVSEHPDGLTSRELGLGMRWTFY
jgi:hypothetical protein